MTKNQLKEILKKIEEKGSVYGLSAVSALAETAGSPERALKIIHVAGTNGKGSVIAFISSVLTEAGYKTGTYTSPAVMSFYDKIKLDGKYITEEEYLDEAKALISLCVKNKISPTLFELETVLAFNYFKKKGCDFVIAEAGLGGELDATNYIQRPYLSIITAIGLDHTSLLGETREEIAAAKAGIIKQGIPVITAENGSVLDVIKNKAKEKGAPLITADPQGLKLKSYDLSGQSFETDGGKTIKISLLGACQKKNLRLALTAIETLKAMGANIPQKSIAAGLLSAKNPARMEVISHNPLFICDGCHNPQGAAALRESVKALFKNKKPIFITGILKDKDYKGILRELIPVSKHIIAITPPSPRALKAEEIVKIAAEAGVPAETADLSAAARLAKRLAGKDDIILACGSLSYMGEIIKLWKELTEY